MYPFYEGSSVEVLLRAERDQARASLSRIETERDALSDMLRKAHETIAELEARLTAARAASEVM